MSIVIPAYNEERRLPRTLDEIARYSAHLARPLEILVCDDGSEDGTGDLVEARGRDVPFLRLICTAASRQGRRRSRRHAGSDHALCDAL